MDGSFSLSLSLSLSYRGVDEVVVQTEELQVVVFLGGLVGDGPRDLIGAEDVQSFSLDVPAVERR